MLNDLSGKAVLVTGGTKGIGLGIGLAFGRLGAVCTLTHKWGSADEDEIRAKFREVGAPEPQIMEADAGAAEDTVELLKAIREKHERIEVFVSNVSFAQVVKGLGDYKKRSLLRSIEYTSWPTFEYALKTKEVFGSFPRYIIGMSSVGPDAFTAGGRVA